MATLFRSIGIHAGGDLDTVTSGALFIGKTNAANVQLSSQTSTTVSGTGNLVIKGNNDTLSGNGNILLGGHAGVMTLACSDRVIIKGTPLVTPSIYTANVAGETFTASDLLAGVIVLTTGQTYVMPTAANLASAFGVSAATFTTAGNRVTFDIILHTANAQGLSLLTLNSGLTFTNFSGTIMTVMGSAIIKLIFTSATTVLVSVSGGVSNWASLTFAAVAAPIASYHNNFSQYKFDPSACTINLDTFLLTDASTPGQLATITMTSGLNLACEATAGVRFTASLLLEEILTYDISSTTVAANTVITTSVSHTIVNGSTIAVSGNSSITESNAYVVSAVSSNTLTIPFNNTLGTSGGVVFLVSPPVSTQIGVLMISNGNGVTLKTTGTIAASTYYRVTGQLVYIRHNT